MQLTEKKLSGLLTNCTSVYISCARWHKHLINGPALCAFQPCAWVLCTTGGALACLLLIASVFPEAWTPVPSHTSKDRSQSHIPSHGHPETSMSEGELLAPFMAPLLVLMFTSSPSAKLAGFSLITQPVIIS